MLCDLKTRLKFWSVENQTLTAPLFSGGERKRFVNHPNSSQEQPSKNQVTCHKSFARKFCSLTSNIFSNTSSASEVQFVWRQRTACLACFGVPEQANCWHTGISTDASSGYSSPERVSCRFSYIFNIMQSQTTKLILGNKCS